MIVVTGATGFIGSNVCEFIHKHHSDKNIVAVDTFDDDNKLKNLSNINIKEFVKPEDLSSFMNDSFENITAVIHMGAISSTTERDLNLIVRNNMNFPYMIWKLCSEKKIKFIYASSAATYGDGSNGFLDSFDIKYLEKIRPINLYGWSKNQFDKWVFQEVKNGNAPPVWAGLKFFNVYGPREDYKAGMKSMVAQAHKQIQKNGKVKLFKSNDKNIKDGHQLRDFIYVKDCVKIIDWILNKSDFGDVINVGTGKARSFNDLVKSVFEVMGKEAKIEYIEMPDMLKEQYQNFTQADICKIKEHGYDKKFYTLEEGVQDYVENYLEKA